MTKLKNLQIELTQFGRLEQDVLDLAHDDITDKDLEEFCRSIQPNRMVIKVRVLNFSHNKLNSLSSIANFIDLFDRESLSEVNLSSNQLNLKIESFNIAKILLQFQFSILKLSENPIKCSQLEQFLVYLQGFSSGHSLNMFVKNFLISHISAKNSRQLIHILNKIIVVFPNVEKIECDNVKYDSSSNDELDNIRTEFIENLRCSVITYIDLRNCNLAWLNFSSLYNKNNAQINCLALNDWDSDEDPVNRKAEVSIETTGFDIEQKTHYSINTEIENEDVELHINEDQSDNYNRFIRWLMRAPVTLRVLLFCAIRYGHPDQKTERKLISSPSVLLPEKNLGDADFIHQFVKGFHFATRTLWPAVFSGIFFHDIAQYYLLPEDRYGNQLKDIFAGTSTNQLTLSTQYGSDVVSEYNFSLGLGLVALSPILTGLLNWSLHYYLSGNTNKDMLKKAFQNLEHADPLETYNVLSQVEWKVLWDKQLSSIDRRLFLNKINQFSKSKKRWLQLNAISILANVADSFKEKDLSRLSNQESAHNLREIRNAALNYLSSNNAEKNNPAYLELYRSFKLWTLGRTQNKKLQTLFSSTVFGYGLYVLYSWARFWESVGEKVKILSAFFQSKAACEAEDKLWRYMAQIAQYQCVVCDDEFMYYGDMLAGQTCLNEYLENIQDPYSLLKKINHILFQPDIKAVSLVKQNISGWTDQLWETFLSSISEKKSHLNSFNLSSPKGNWVWLQDNKILVLNDFLKKVSVDSVSLKNLNIGPDMFKQLLPSFNTSFVKEWLLANNNLGDNSIIELINLIRNKTLSLDLSWNQISNYGVSHFFDELSYDTVFNDLDLSGNIFSGPGVNAIAKALPSLKIKTLNLSHINLSSSDLTALGKGIENSLYLENIDLSNCQLSDDQLIQLAPYFGKSNLTSIDVSGNLFTDKGTMALFESMPNSSVKVLVMNNNGITDEGLSKISTQFNQTALVEFQIAANRFTAQGLKELLAGIKNSLLQRLNLADNALGDEVGTVLETAYQNQTLSLTSINLANNNIGEQGGLALASILPDSHLEEINLENNQITSPVVDKITEGMPQSNLTNINFSNNNIEGKAAKKFISELGKTRIIKFYFNGNPLGAGVGEHLAQNLISPTPHLAEDGAEHIGRDEIRALHQAKPITNVTEVGLANTQQATSDAILLCRTWPNVGSSKKNLNLADNPTHSEIINDENCQMSSASSHSPSVVHYISSWFISSVEQIKKNIPALPDSTQFNFFTNNKEPAKASVQKWQGAKSKVSLHSHQEEEAIWHVLLLLIFFYYSFFSKNLSWNKQEEVYKTIDLKNKLSDLRKQLDAYENNLNTQKQSYVYKSGLGLEKIDKTLEDLIYCQVELEKLSHRRKIKGQEIHAIERKLSDIKNAVHQLKIKNKELKQIRVIENRMERRAVAQGESGALLISHDAINQDYTVTILDDDKASALKYYHNTNKPVLPRLNVDETISVVGELDDIHLEINQYHSMSGLRK